MLGNAFPKSSHDILCEEMHFPSLVTSSSARKCISQSAKDLVSYDVILCEEMHFLNNYLNRYHANPAKPIVINAKLNS